MSRRGDIERIGQQRLGLGDNQRIVVFQRDLAKNGEFVSASPLKPVPRMRAATVLPPPPDHPVLACASTIRRGIEAPARIDAPISPKRAR
ncbi:MAG: hypothetical protein U0841_27745 [Chloroflexia bacterium]